MYKRQALKKVVEPMGHEVVNDGMYAADDAAQLTYVPVSYTHLDVYKRQTLALDAL